jgi:hypothetical protein
MQRIYTVLTPDQLSLYEPDIRAGIDSILASAHEHGRDIRTPDDIWDELVEHVEIAPHARFFVVIEDGILRAWLAAKIYVDGKKRNGCITWAWATPGCKVSRDVVMYAEDYFRERNCQTAYLGRSFLQTSFSRLMRRYGYTMASVVYEKKLDGESHGGIVRPPSGEVRSDEAGRDADPIPADDGAAAAATAHGPAQPGDGGSDGEPTEHGDIDPDAASGVELPGDDAGAAASGVGQSGSAPLGTASGVGRDGDGGGGSVAGLDAGSGSESGGPADERAARAS